MKRKAVGCLGVLLSIPIVLFLVSYFLVPASCHDYLECDSHMRAIWSALRKYADEHEGKYPERLEELHPEYIDLTKAKCTMCRARRDSLETGYYYIAGLGPEDNERKPLLFCERYHLNGHGPGTYRAQFSILLQGGGIAHVRDADIGKYDGPMRRYPYFRKFPYDGSRPTLELVRSLEDKFPERTRPDAWIDVVGR